MCEAVAAGVDQVQIRERELEGRALLDHARGLARAARAGAEARGGRVRVVLNRRCDVAAAAGLDGVHLGFDALSPGEAREALSALGMARPWLGASTHSPEEAAAAARAGSDYVHLAPVFDPLSKPASRPPLGTEALARASKTTDRPVLAQGGIEPGNAGAAVAAGAAGVAVTGAVLGATHRGGVRDAVRRLRADLDQA